MTSTRPYIETLRAGLKNYREAASYLLAAAYDEIDGEEAFLMALRDVAEVYGITRQAILEEREACAKFIDMRADRVEQEGFGITSLTIARIYRDEANAIRNRETP